jgi:3-oxoacyl-[acyl-carrier protein] reductase
MTNLKDKVVLITGSSQGIGKTIALEFASQGAKIVLNDIPSQEAKLKKTKKEIKNHKVEVDYCLADISKYEEVEIMMGEIKEKFGQLDILVNNAGICLDKTLAKMSVQEWQKVIDVDLTGVFNCSKAALPLIIPAKGKIINLASVVGQRGNFGQTNYGAAKAGIIGFTKSLAKELGKFGVTVNAVAPGFIRTRLTERIPEKFQQQVKMLTALGRFGEPKEVASVITFLASEKASFITGAIINIDGGLSI